MVGDHGARGTPVHNHAAPVARVDPGHVTIHHLQPAAPRAQEALVKARTATRRVVLVGGT